MLKEFSIFQIVLLGSFGALAIAAVLVFAFVVGQDQGASIGEVEIWGTLDQGAFTTVIRQLMEEESRFRQVTYVQKRPETFDQELTNALASGSGPELYILRSDFAEKNLSKTLAIPYASLSKEQFDSAFIQGAENFLVPDGVLAVPFAADPLVLYWNKDLFAAAGIAKAPAYWDQFFEVATLATKRDPTNSLEKSGVALGEFANVTHAKLILSTLIMQAGGRLTQRDGTGQLAPALVARVGEAQRAADSALLFYTDFANPIKTHYSWNRARPESRVVFGAGDLALYIGLASEEPLIRRINPNLNFAVAPIPQIRDEARLASGGYVYGYAIPKASVNPEGALTVAYLLSAQNPASLISQALGLPPARRDLLSVPSTGNDDLFNKQTLLIRSWTDPDPERTDVIFRDMIQSVTSGAAKISEAIQRADRAFADVMNSL